MSCSDIEIVLIFFLLADTCEITVIVERMKDKIHIVNNENIVERPDLKEDKFCKTGRRFC